MGIYTTEQYNKAKPYAQSKHIAKLYIDRINNKR